MATTGAPWNLPYPLDTDLVIDGASGIEALAEATAAGLTATGPAFSTAASNSVDIDFSVERVITRTATGTVAFTGSAYAAGRSASVRVVAGASSRTLTFPAGWKFVSVKPTSLAANKVGVLAATSFGTVEGDVVCAFAAEA
jgi:hypothetical protein